ncbi:MAG TPA: hypothetical protein VNL71_04525, partial [Chloroflexota bacterium]|nr:hypothetical protein [Chloroflexota bacterium]
MAIVPGEMNFALGFGGTYGKGVASCRNSKSWSAPIFIQVGGGSWGLQIGAAWLGRGGPPGGMSGPFAPALPTVQTARPLQLVETVSCRQLTGAGASAAAPRVPLKLTPGRVPRPPQAGASVAGA